MKKVELLAPVGSSDALRAAVNSGADAVYMGGKMLNARINANNFDNEEIKEAIKYAKLRGVKVYITLNTIVFNDEICDVPAYVNELHEMGADAVIVQDLGLARLLAKTTNIPLHASTQMGIHNLHGLKYLESLGFERAVLSREVPLSTIKELKANSDMEIETFIHGALCSSFSGQCLYSYINGKRSGNRGVCAQPCRLKYNGNKTNYPLSTKDIMTVECIGDLIESGIDSFKIEGRIKRPEYVAVTVGVYRKAIDAYYENKPFDVNKAIEELTKIYNRGGFSKGYYFDKNNIFGTLKPNHLGEMIGKVQNVGRNKITIKTDKTVNVYDGLSFANKPIGMEISDLYERDKRVTNGSGILTFSSVLKGVEKGDIVYRTTDRTQIDKAREVIEKDDFKILTNGQCEIGKDVKLTLSANGHIVEYVKYDATSPAQNKPLDNEGVRKSLTKTGNTVFEFENLDITVEDGLFMPVKELNEVRREAFNLLEQEIIKSPVREKSAFESANVKYPNTNIKVAITDNENANIKGYDYAFMILRSINENTVKLKPGFSGIVLPPITFDEDLEYIKSFVNNELIVVCNNISQYEALKGKCRLWAGMGMNVANQHTVDYLYELGFEMVVQCIETEKDLKGTIRVKAGKIPVMNFVACPMKADAGCDKCKQNKFDKDFRCTVIKNRFSAMYENYNNGFGNIDYLTEKR